MYLTRKQNTDLFQNFNSVMDELFSAPSFRLERTANPAVNVSENENSFNMDMAIPGLNKEDFKVDLKNDLLVVSAEKEETKEENDKFTRREFSYSSFERSFKLPKNINKENITAKYENGVLKIQIPKQEMQTTENRLISVD